MMRGFLRQWLPSVRELCRAAVFVLAMTILATPTASFAESIEELRENLEEKRSSLEETKERIEQFKQEIQRKKQKAETLEDQIGLIETNIREIELRIEQTKKEIATNEAEIAAVEKEIEAKEQEMAEKRALLAEYIRAIHLVDQQSTVSILLKYDTFSQVIQEADTLGELQERSQRALESIQALHEELTSKRTELEDFHDTLASLKERQERQQQTLTAQQASKERVLSATEQEKAEYESLLQQAKEAHEQAQSDIASLDKQIRERLEQQGVGQLASVGTMSWPINPIFGISCGFHCPGYPYEHLIGPHTGVDLPTYVGTPIKAPAEGYVARTHDAGGPGYSYIMLVHGDDITTVYGHVSGFAVEEDQVVTAGTVIGYTGGAPGSRGAGLSSGPHLHFEVRKNNQPTNPLQYLGARP